MAAGAAGAAGGCAGGAGGAGGVVRGLAACSARAWRRTGPTVLVFEDLHWADDALLAFLEHLADWAEGVPLLVLVYGAAGAVRAAPDVRRERCATRSGSTWRR